MKCWDSSKIDQLNKLIRQKQKDNIVKTLFRQTKRGSFYIVTLSTFEMNLISCVLTEALCSLFHEQSEKYRRKFTESLAFCYMFIPNFCKQFRTNQFDVCNALKSIKSHSPCTSKENLPMCNLTRLSQSRGGEQNKNMNILLREGTNKIQQMLTDIIDWLVLFSFLGFPVGNGTC